jgi:hypothetical protein
MRWLKGAANLVGGGLFLTLFAVFVLQVIARFIFNKPMAWTDEMAVILYVGSSCGAAPRWCLSASMWCSTCCGTAWAGAHGQAMKIVGNLMVGGLALAAMPGHLGLRQVHEPRRHAGAGSCRSAGSSFHS